MPAQMELILASASPRRHQLLCAVGLDLTVSPQDVDESQISNETPMAYALRTATAKAMACTRKPEQIVLAADTVVAFAGQSMGKPQDDDEACEMLAKLSGQTHVVHTAVIAIGRTVLSDLVSTRVRFRDLNASEIKRYVARGESQDKAGAYGIQGEGGALIAHVEGSYTNVVGLPLVETLRILNLLGID
jgi:septum formation protein